MTMFPIFIIGLLAGIGLGIAFTNLYYHYKQTVPSEAKFHIQEATIISLREDIKALEIENEKLRNQLTDLKEK